MDITSLALIALLPAIIWFFLWRWRDKEKEPFRAMLYCFLLGMGAVVPFFLLGVFWPDLLEGYGSAGSIFGFAFAEELVKGLMLILGIELSRRWFTQIVDGLIYGSAVALGFAFLENILYLIPYPEISGTFVYVYLIRSLDTMVAHSLFTAFFGFFYASAYLRKEIFPRKKKRKTMESFLEKFVGVLAVSRYLGSYFAE